MISNIRNFCIISHIDHGKSTLADRFLELTETIPRDKMQPQYLDMMDLEREKGITIKMQPVRMIWHLPNHPEIRNPKSEIRKKIQEDNLGFSVSNLGFKDSEFILNLIDTPGHVDFSYEVSRSLAAVEGAILLVDATQGIQAQTLANLELAKAQNLVIIPVVNKIDLAWAKVEETINQIARLLQIDKDQVLKISAKYGTNVDKLLEEIVKKVPPPQGSAEDSLQALIFDSVYDSYLGVVAYVRIFQGKVKKGDEIYLAQAKVISHVKEVGYFTPKMMAEKELKAGEIGYVALGIKEPGVVKVGETIILKDSDVSPLPGYKEPKSVVFASVFPKDQNKFDALKIALSKLKLNDAALHFEQASGLAGRGFKCGFLGVLHAQIVSERLKREFGLDLIITTPTVAYKIIDKRGEEKVINTIQDFPHFSQIKLIKEQYVNLKIITPQEFLGPIMGLLGQRQPKIYYLGGIKVMLECLMPLREIIIGFYDQLKSISHGFASMDYKIIGWQESDLVKINVLIAGKKEEMFSQIVPRAKAQEKAKEIVEKLKQAIPPQLFAVSIQAEVNGRIIASRSIRARAKDVIAPLYGGDYTRKRKLLEKQKKGKKKLAKIGQVRIPQDVIWKILEI